MSTPGLEPNVHCTNDAVDKSSQNSMAVILKVLDDAFVQVSKASERQTTTLASIEENIFVMNQMRRKKRKIQIRAIHN